MEHTTQDDGYRTSLSTPRRSEHAASTPLRVELSSLPKREPLTDHATGLYHHRTCGEAGCHDIDILRRVAAGIRLLSDQSDRQEHDAERDTARLQQEIDGVIARWRASRAQVRSDR